VAPAPHPGPEGEGAKVSFGFRRVAPQEKARLVREHFDRVAATYDLGNTVLSLGLHHLWKRAAVRDLGLRPGARVLDLCGGTADLALRAARAVGPDGAVVLVDINRSMMERGRAKAARGEPGGRVQFAQGDAEALCLGEGRFDAAMVGFGIRNLNHLEQGFREMHRVLKPGGTLLCLEFSHPTSAWFRRLYDLYSFTLMPVLSRAIVGKRESYVYLAESIRTFPKAEELSEILRGLGFSRVGYRLLSNGIAAIHRGVKAEE
jgi:demethylmenaquinone methyltransferase/2-methoxy-6-polyprenyl-1,4-benzoquinol methylase